MSSWSESPVRKRGEGKIRDYEEEKMDEKTKEKEKKKLRVEKKEKEVGELEMRKKEKIKNEKEKTDHSTPHGKRCKHDRCPFEDKDNPYDGS